jgi:general secretion pathway protein N
MMGLPLSRRARITLLALFLFGLLLFLPLRVAFAIAGLDRLGVSGRDVRGSIWSGRVDQLMIGAVPMGHVQVELSPLSLLVGRARFDLSRQAGLPDDIGGALTVGFGRIGIDDVTGTVPLGHMLAPLPISSLAMEDVSVRFAGGRCGHAEGRVRAQVAGQLPGINLAQGLSGTASCDGEALLLPLVSQSGLEKITLRLWESGRYVAKMRIETSDPATAGALGAVGFRGVGNAQYLSIDGSL